MSLVPMIFSNWWEDLEHPHHLPAQHFAIDVNPERLRTPMSTSPHFYNHPLQTLMNYYRPKGGMMSGEQGLSVVKSDKNKFEAALDVQQFAPDEIKVKVIDNYAVVEGKHEKKRDDHGFVTRQFIRKYLIPEQCDIDKVTSSLSSDGVLTINAPRKQQPDDAEKERLIDIKLTGKPAVASSCAAAPLGGRKEKCETMQKGEKDTEKKELSDETMMKNGDEK